MTIVSDHTDEESGTHVTPSASDDIDDVPTISCSRCGREWTLAHELDDLRIGNQAVEKFALDHMRHTGHYPDDVSTWLAECRQCPDGDESLSESAARRWAATHARHTRHRVEIRHDDDQTAVVEPEDP